jgi:hypothetical protein
MIINVLTILHNSPGHRKLLSSAQSLLVTTITYIICFVLSGGIRSTNIIMYIPHIQLNTKWHQLNLSVGQDSLSSALASDAGSPQPEFVREKKMHATSCPTTIKNGVVLSSECHSPHNHDHFLLCLAMLSLVKLPLRAEHPPPVTP